jgi:hypothetical protein
MKRADSLIGRAVDNGMAQVLIGRFPDQISELPRAAS